MKEGVRLLNMRERVGSFPPEEVAVPLETVGGSARTAKVAEK